MAPFSGGEKARLALALIAWTKPNLLLMDEPTNHLDIEMRQALTVALQAFAGALILVSHDRHLMANAVDQFLLVEDGYVSVFAGDLADYRNRVLPGKEKDVLPALNLKTVRQKRHTSRTPKPVKRSGN